MPSATTSHTRDLVSGAVKPEGIGLTTLKLPLETIAYRFLGGFEWEVSEFSLATYCTFVSDGNSPMVGIPVFPSRVFGHGSILLREGSPVRMAAELMGKRIGIPQWTQTAVPYVRSWLQHDAGVALTSVDWVQAGVNDPGRKEMVAFELLRGLPAVSVWGLSFQVLEQMGFRKIVDTSFMIAFMFPDNVDPADVEKYMNGLKRAQMDLDFAPEKYRHYYLNEIPERYKSEVDVRRFSPGERIVFLPYTEEVYAKTQAWIHERGIFEGQVPGFDYVGSVAA